MNEEGPRFDSGFDDNESFPVSPVPGGVSLESALADFGPAAIDDLLVRLRALARRLDRAHAAGTVHGALHPGNVIITDTATSLVGGGSPRAPYAAPEVLRGEPATAAADQFGLAAITFEWLFARPIQGPAVRPVEVRTMPGVDRGALSKAFSIALAPEPGERFASCSAFGDAVAAAIIPELPLLADTEEGHQMDPQIRHRFSTDSLHTESEAAADAAASDAEAVADFVAESSLLPMADTDDVKIVAEELKRTAASQEPLRELDDDETPLSTPLAAAAAEPVAVPAWNPSPVMSPPSTTARFGGFALIFAAVVGGLFGFAAGYMARPRALQTGQPQTIVTEPAAATEPVPANPAASGKPAASESASVPVPSAPAAANRGAGAASAVGSLLVRSTPSGASVSVDGAAKGVTPLALRDLPSGTRTITLTHPGYVAETRKVQISDARPSRSLEVRLSAEPPARTAAPAPRPATPATLGKPSATTGSLIVESRPTGANVSINGRDSGKTPLVVSDLSPGGYQVVLSMPGYRNFATTVRVVAGERARAAASLTAVEQE